MQAELMSSAAEHFPLFYPPETRRHLARPQLVRRVARIAGWGEGSRLLDLGAGTASLYLARELGCSVVVVDSGAGASEPPKERPKPEEHRGRVELRQIPLEKLPFGEGEFEGILALGAVPMPLAQAISTLKGHLAGHGRLALSYPVKVGQSPLKVAVEFWEQKLGEPLLTPRELAQALEREGFEPEAVECLDDAALDDFYREVEPLLEKLPAELGGKARLLREEIELHRSQGGRGSTTLAMAVARKRVSGEKPPPARSGG